MNRRQALQMMAIIGGGTVIGLDMFLKGCTTDSTVPITFSPDDIALLDQVGEIIIPTTNTPGAKATHIGEFMQVIVRDCYTEPQQQVFIKGMTRMNKEANKLFGKNFLQADLQQQTELVTQLNQEAKVYGKNLSKEALVKSPHYFTLFKQLTVWGYFTSEIGQTEALNFVLVPGKFEGCVPYKKGERVFC